MRASDLAELVRLPAALSVPGDVLVGAAAAGWPAGRRTLGLVGASVSLYWAGMVLNDWADRDVDVQERPHRPIPSGRVRPGAALALATGLTAAGLGVAAAAGGRRSLAVAVPLAGTVWAYDLGGRGPVLMATARALDVLLGAGGRARALPVAATVAAHTAVLTGLSAAETTGGPAGARRARTALAGTAAVTALAARGAGPLGAGLVAAYAGSVGGAQLAAARDPRPARLQQAVGAGVLGLIPLEAALLARGGAPRLAAAVATLWPLARRLSRRVSPT